MDSSERKTVRDVVARDAEGVLTDLEARWDVTRIDSILVEPMPDHGEPAYPESADEFYDEFYHYAAGAAVVDDEGRLLTVYDPVREWETPGGIGEPGEKPAETAQRETVEETGIECEITGVLFARLMEVDLGGPEPLPIPVVVFTAKPTGGSELDDSEIEQHAEIADLAWFGPDELPIEMREYEQKHDYLVSQRESASSD